MQINKERRRKKVAFRKSHDSSCKTEQRRSPEASRFEKINLERKICVFFGCVDEFGGHNRLEMRRYFCSEQGNGFPSGKIRVRALQRTVAVKRDATTSVDQNTVKSRQLDKE